MVAKKLITVFFGILLVVGVFILGVYLGFEQRPEVQKIIVLFNKENGVSGGAAIDFAPFWKAWNIIDEQYVNGKSPAATSSTDVLTNGGEESFADRYQARVRGAIAGMVESLGDPYSVFLPPEEKKSFEEDVRGDFGGIGIEIGIREGVLTVISPLTGTPAARAGIKSGDRITHIDGKLSATLPVDEAVRKIRGAAGKEVSLTISRPGQTPAQSQSLTVNLKREIITVPTIKTSKTPEGVFVISLFSFSARAPELFRQALREFVDAGTDKLILDLRGNPGGFLEVAIDVTSWFLPAGKTVVVEKRADGKDKIHRSRGYDVFTDKLKMVVLIDGGSASGSEIVAGALSEHGRATLIGSKTFGKGSVQELIPLDEESSLKLTVAKWFTPKGHSFSSGGLEPDIPVTHTDGDRQAGRDPELSAAVRFLTTDIGL